MYDSRTDRADFSGPRWDTDTPWQYRNNANVEDRKGKKRLKRSAAKRDRRSAFPRRGFRGYGYGEQCMWSMYW